MVLKKRLYILFCTIDNPISLNKLQSLSYAFVKMEDIFYFLPAMSSILLLQWVSSCIQSSYYYSHYFHSGLIWNGSLPLFTDSGWTCSNFSRSHLGRPGSGIVIMQRAHIPPLCTQQVSGVLPVITKNETRSHQLGAVQQVARAAVLCSFTVIIRIESRSFLFWWWQ